MLSFPICHPIFQTVCSDRVMGGECLFIRPQKGESHLVRLPQKLDSFNICVFKLETEKWELLNFAGKALASRATLCLVGAASKSNSSGTHLSIDPSANLLNLVKIFVQHSRQLFVQHSQKKCSFANKYFPQPLCKLAQFGQNICSTPSTEPGVTRLVLAWKFHFSEKSFLIRIVYLIELEQFRFMTNTGTGQVPRQIS